MNYKKIPQKSVSHNKVALLGFGLILLVVAFTFIKPLLKDDSKKEDTTPTPANIHNNYEYLTSKELQEKINKKDNLVIVDIRDSVNFNEEHIENSLNLTPDKIADELDKIDKDALIVIVGYNFEDKNAEAGAMQFFKDSEFKNIKALAGGIFAWKMNAKSTIRIGDPENSLDVSKIEYILPAQIKLAIDNNYPLLIIDTRSNNLFSQGHIPTAKNIPFKDLEKRKNEISPIKEIIVYGDSSLIDFQSGVKLHDLGFLATYIIDGGLRSWQEKDFPLAK